MVKKRVNSIGKHTNVDLDVDIVNRFDDNSIITLCKSKKPKKKSFKKRGSQGGYTPLFSRPESQCIVELQYSIPCYIRTSFRGYSEYIGLPQSIVFG